MPVQKKAAKKAAAKKSAMALTPRAKKEVYVNLSKKFHVRFAGLVPGEADKNFEYTLTVDGVDVSLLDINGTVVSPIKSSDKILADTGKPFYIHVNASLNSPTGSGSLQLKYLTKNKNVFDAPQEFEFETTGNGGLFLEDVKLP
jgi:hypothetical protein